MTRPWIIKTRERTIFRDDLWSSQFHALKFKPVFLNWWAAKLTHSAKILNRDFNSARNMTFHSSPLCIRDFGQAKLGHGGLILDSRQF